MHVCVGTHLESLLRVNSGSMQHCCKFDSEMNLDKSKLKGVNLKVYVRGGQDVSLRV